MVTQILTSSLKTLEVLAALADEPQGVGVSELARRTGGNRGYVHRQLVTLCAGGWPASATVMRNIARRKRHLRHAGVRGVRRGPPAGGLPYHAQLLSAYMMRELSADLVDALAARRSDTAVALDPQVRRFLGVGNSSALGLVLWVGNHPVLVDRWISLREQALCHARGLGAAPGSAVGDALVALLERAALYHSEDVNEYTCFTPAERIVADLRRVLAAIPQRAAAAGADGRVPTVAELVDGVEGVCDEAAEVVNSVLTELDPGESDRLAAELTVDETFRRDGSTAVGELRALLAEQYAWALAVDRTAPGAVANTWYKSRSAEEPRCGATSELPEGTVDLTVDVPGMVQHLDGVLAAEDPALPVGRLLARRPELRGAVERLQSLAGHAYAVPHANIRDAAFVPARIIRLANAALYGLERTKDYLGRDLRGVIFQGAPDRGRPGRRRRGPPHRGAHGGDAQGALDARPRVRGGQAGAVAGRAGPGVVRDGGPVRQHPRRAGQGRLLRRRDREAVRRQLAAPVPADHRRGPAGRPGGRTRDRLDARGPGGGDPPGPRTGRSGTAPAARRTHPAPAPPRTPPGVTSPDSSLPVSPSGDPRCPTAPRRPSPGGVPSPPSSWPPS
ncbi:hypothetical protein STENM327S_07659 [Streptomyces tendae]